MPKKKITQIIREISDTKKVRDDIVTATTLLREVDRKMRDTADPVASMEYLSNLNMHPLYLALKEAQALCNDHVELVEGIANNTTVEWPPTCTIQE